MKRYLLTPGPTPVPEDISLAMAEPIIHHRTKEFASILKDTEKKLKYVFKTENDVIIFSATGTGAMHASVSNFLSSTDKALIVEGGKFGERFAKICKAFGVEFIPIKIEWGETVDPQIIKDKLDEDKSIKAVYTTLCETSTGVLTDIKAISEIVKDTDAILVVDAISALGSCQLETDKWEVDVVVSGSQKGLMTPPGLSFMSVNEKAWSKAQNSDLPEFYFDIIKARKSLEKFNTPWTSPVNLIKGLNVALKRIQDEGIDNFINRSAMLARATRSAVKALNLELFASKPANTVTAVKSPEGINGQDVVKIMKESLGVSIAGGQAHLKGKIFRIGHMGFIEKFDIIAAISALEIALEKLDYDLKLGTGISAAEKILINL